MSKCRLALAATMLAVATPSVASAQPQSDKDDIAELAKLLGGTPPAATTTPAATGKPSGPGRPGSQDNKSDKSECKSGEVAVKGEGDKVDCKNFDQYVAEKAAAAASTAATKAIEEYVKKQGEPKGLLDENKNCVFGPPPTKDEKGVIKQPEKCLTFEETQPTIPNWLNTLLALGLGTTAVGYTVKSRQDVKDFTKRVCKKLGIRTEEDEEKKPVAKKDKKGDKKA